MNKKEKQMKEEQQQHEPFEHGKTKQGTYFVLVRPESEPITNPVVLIHGINTYNKVWRDLQMTLKSKGILSVSYDLLGRGYSNEASDDTYGGDQHVAQLNELIQHIEQEYHTVKKWHIVGHSMGGAIAALFASRVPARVASVCLFTPAGLMKSTLIDVAQTTRCFHYLLQFTVDSPSILSFGVRRNFYHQHGIYAERQARFVEIARELRQISCNVGYVTAKSIAEFPLNHLDQDIHVLSQHRVSILMIWAKQDLTIPLVPSSTNWRTILQRPTAQCRVQEYVLDKAGHGFIWEYPTKTVQLLFDFLTSHSNSK